jgi:hypothetical protein
MKESIKQLKLLLAKLLHTNTKEDQQRIDLLKSNIKMMEAKFEN